MARGVRWFRGCSSRPIRPAGSGCRGGGRALSVRAAVPIPWAVCVNKLKHPARPPQRPRRHHQHLRAGTPVPRPDLRRTRRCPRPASAPLSQHQRTVHRRTQTHHRRPPRPQSRSTRRTRPAKDHHLPASLAREHRDHRLRHQRILRPGSVARRGPSGRANTGEPPTGKPRQYTFK